MNEKEKKLDCSRKEKQKAEKAEIVQTHSTYMLLSFLVVSLACLVKKIFDNPTTLQASKDLTDLCHLCVYGS